MSDKKGGDSGKKSSSQQDTRRAFIKGGITAVPVVLTLTSRPAFAKSSGNTSTKGGSAPPGKRKGGSGKKKGGSGKKKGGSKKKRR